MQNIPDYSLIKIASGSYFYTPGFLTQTCLIPMIGIVLNSVPKRHLLCIFVQGIITYVDPDNVQLID